MPPMYVIVRIAALLRPLPPLARGALAQNLAMAPSPLTAGIAVKRRRERRRDPEALLSALTQRRTNMTTELTPLGAVGRGVVAGLIGTGLMTIAQELSAKLQSPDNDGQQGEGSTQQEQGAKDPWEQASAPAKVGKRISEGVFGQEVSAERIPLLTHGMHWGYGTGWGAVYGLAQGSLHAPTLRHGLVFGSAVWAMSYVQLVPMGLYQPPWKYPPKDIALEVGYHLVYGLGVASAFRAVDSR